MAITTEVGRESKSGCPETLKEFDIFTIKGTKYICVSTPANCLGQRMPRLMTFKEWKLNQK